MIANIGQASAAASAWARSSSVLPWSEAAASALVLQHADDLVVVGEIKDLRCRGDAVAMCRTCVEVHNHPHKHSPRLAVTIPVQHTFCMDNLLHAS